MHRLEDVPGDMVSARIRLTAPMRVAAASQPACDNAAATGDRVVLVP
ncbi:hypothetical protein [Pseudofrankia asymbiotica]|nr:hypothetical protein [Pseudofrankia asymbiotica]